jgi:hypothetical protein
MKSWKKTALALVWGLALAGWMALVGIYLTDPSLAEWTAAVATVAVMTEIAFWVTAGVLGVTIVESRKAIWRFVTRPFRRSS